MKKSISYRIIEGKHPVFIWALAVSTLLILVGLYAVYNMEHHGHVITGMTNQIVWGLPHVFAIFLIVAASGVLNVASISSVFRKSFYHPLARLSALLAITLLVGGLMVLVLDLGHPDRLIVAMTHYNFKSIFSWNIILYNGFIGICVVYIWVMMERRLQGSKPTIGLLAFVWRLVLTTGTGSIFGFLMAREAYDTAILPPLFIALSLVLGLAVFLLLLMFFSHSLGERILQRPKTLLGVLIAAVFYFVLAYHLTHLYITGRHGVEYFILADSGIYTILFWGGYIFLGTILPLLLLYHERFSHSRVSIGSACFFSMLGGFSLLYVIIIGGQAYPLDIFPGMEVISSSFFDGASKHPYTPSGWEFMLGMAGISVSIVLTLVAMKILPFLPANLTDRDIDPEMLD